MRCAQCQADNPAGNRFCEQCGTPLEARCSQCNTPVRPGTRFCGVCGHRLVEPETQGQPLVSQPPSISLPAGTDYHSRLASYTPKHLVDKIFTTRSALEGERRNTGLVVVGKIGNDLRMKYTAVGDTTN